MDINFLMKTRINLIKMLKYRNIDVSSFENFNQDEMLKMLQQSLIDKSFVSPEMGPLDLIVKNRHGHHSRDSCHHPHKSFRDRTMDQDGSSYQSFTVTQV